MVCPMGMSEKKSTNPSTETKTRSVATNRSTGIRNEARTSTRVNIGIGIRTRTGISILQVPARIRTRAAVARIRTERVPHPSIILTAQARTRTRTRKNIEKRTRKGKGKRIRIEKRIGIRTKKGRIRTRIINLVHLRTSKLGFLNNKLVIRRNLGAWTFNHLLENF